MTAGRDHHAPQYTPDMVYIVDRGRTRKYESVAGEGAAQQKLRTFDVMTNEDEGSTRLSLGAKNEGQQMRLRGPGGGRADRYRGRGGDRQPGMPLIRVWLSRSNPYDCEIEPTCRVSLSYICCDKRDPTPGRRLERQR